MVPYLVRMIKHLSQKEGLNDQEIAEKLGCSRATVNRTRLANNIPVANLKNRKDKTYTCKHCNDTVTIARKERKRLYCPVCREKLGIDKYKKEG